MRWSCVDRMGAGLLLLAAACGTDSVSTPSAADGTTGSMDPPTTTTEDPSSTSSDEPTTEDSVSSTSEPTSTSNAESSSSTGDPFTTSETDDPSGSGSSSSSEGSTGPGDPCAVPMLAEDVILDADIVAQERVDDPGDPTHHLIQIYEGRLYGVDAPVTFNLPGNNVLILHANNATQWAVELGPMGELDEVIVFGSQNSATVPDSVTLTEMADLPSNNCDDESCDLTATINSVESALGITVDSGDAAYEAHFFEFEPPAECGGTPGEGGLSCLDPGGPAGASQDDCDSILAESMYCAFLRDGDELRLAGLDSGDDCSLASLMDAIDLGFVTNTSLGWVGDSLYVCDGNVVRIDPGTGDLEDTGVTCEMVSDLDGGIIVSNDDFPEQALDHYPGYDALIAGTPSTQVSVDASAVQQLAGDEATAYYAWFSDDRLSSHDVASGTRQPDVPLLCHDTWIHGFDVVDGIAYVLNHSDGAIYAHDAATGDLQLEITVNLGLDDIGLACRANP